MNRLPIWLTNYSIAHRGFQDKKNGIIENTLEACLLAVEKGYPIEIDVKLTDEGDIILFHDLKTNRLTNLNKKATELTKKDIETIYYKNSKCKIAYLKDVLNKANGKIPILIELKFDGNIKRIKQLAKQVSFLLKDYKGKYAVQSFYSNIKKIYNKYDENCPVGIIMPFSLKKGRIGKKINNLSLFISLRYTCDFITLGSNFLVEKNFKKIISKKKPLLFWHITNKKRENIARKYNANIIFADYQNIGYQAPKTYKKEDN